MPIENLADPEGIRDRPGGEIVSQAARDEAERCANLRADALLLAAGAGARAELYTPTLIAGLSIGTVGFMLAKILNGEVEVRDAKQAIEVAKIALLISDKVTDDENLGRSASGGITSPSERAELIARKDDLLEILRSRAKDAVEKYGADAAGGGFDASEWDLDDESPAPPHLRSVPSAPMTPAKVS